MLGQRPAVLAPQGRLRPGEESSATPFGRRRLRHFPALESHAVCESVLG